MISFINFKVKRTARRIANGETKQQQHHQELPSTASLLNGSASKGKRSLASAIFVAVLLIAATLVVALPSYPNLAQATPQATQLDPATTQIINQIATQVALAQGVNSADVSQVLQQIAIQISEGSSFGTTL